MVLQHKNNDLPVIGNGCTLVLDTGRLPKLTHAGPPSIQDARIVEGCLGTDELPGRLTGSRVGRKDFSQFNLKHLQKLRIKDDSCNIPEDQTIGTICDFPLRLVKKQCSEGGKLKRFAEWTLRSAARGFQRLMENLAVPYEKRCNAIQQYAQSQGKDVASTGFYFVDPLHSVMKRFKEGGAVLIGLYDKKHRLRGGITVDVDPSTLFKDDQELIEEFKRSPYYDPEKTYSVLYAAGIDRGLELPVKEGGFGISRSELYKCLHALAIDKVRSMAPQVTHLISCVREFPCVNPAAKAHGELGWIDLPGLIERIPHFIRALGQTAMVEHQLLELEVWSDKQTEIITWAREFLEKHPELPFRFYTAEEQDPDPPPLRVSSPQDLKQTV